MSIPIENILYMLSYSWDMLDVYSEIKYDKDDHVSNLDFYAKLLNSAFSRQLKKGLLSNYQNRVELTPVVRGKINFPQSLSKSTFIYGKAVCEFDEFSLNNDHNKLIKYTFVKLLRTQKLAKSNAVNIFKNIKYLSKVDYEDVRLKKNKLHRLPSNFKLYSFIENLCLLILNEVSLNQKTGNESFYSLDKNPYKMRRLFENFVYKFYKNELGADFFVSGAKQYKYEGLDNAYEDNRFIPTLKTDIELYYKVEDKKIIIDTKFEKKTLDINFFSEKERVKSKYLMQLMTYLENYKRFKGIIPSGILLYPTTSKEYSIDTKVWDYKVSLYTINLNQPWQGIHSNLLDLIYKHMNIKPKQLSVEKSA